MEPGDVREVTAGDCTDLSYVDVELFGTSGYGAVYLIDDDRPAIVDTGLGTNYEYVLEALEEVGIGRDGLEVIAVTHIHLDHAGGAGLIADACPNAEVYVPAVGARHLYDPERLVEGTKTAVGDQWEYYTEPEPLPEERTVEYEDGDVIDLGTQELRVHAAPGHAPHHFVFEEPANDVVFVADAAGLWIPEREQVMETSPPSQFDFDGCLEDLETLKAIDPDVFCYPHFGPRYVGDEAAEALEEYGRVLTEWVETVEAKREEFGDDEAVVEYFADRPKMVEQWGERKAREERKLNTRGVLGYLDWRDSR